MARPVRFEHYRYLGDKRTMLVHDTDAATDQCPIDELAAEPILGLVFGPDTVPEARNRGFRPCRHCLPAAVKTDDDAA
jgi:hypothetical protein